jgi:hypothetical protein
VAKGEIVIEGNRIAVSITEVLKGLDAIQHM